ncbi:Uncharacterized protein HZ326_10108 [Fusarium oxysporum f. sp. albedinis]|nr:Uncharacterized protein HZ326_10108 [Fusarium oxysporum f. sp. albedinis]
MLQISYTYENNIQTWGCILWRLLASYSQQMRREVCSRGLMSGLFQPETEVSYPAVALRGHDGSCRDPSLSDDNEDGKDIKHITTTLRLPSPSSSSQPEPQTVRHHHSHIFPFHKHEIIIHSHLFFHNIPPGFPPPSQSYADPPSPLSGLPLTPHLILPLHSHLPLAIRLHLTPHRIILHRLLLAMKLLMG